MTLSREMVIPSYSHNCYDLYFTNKETEAREAEPHSGVTAAEWQPRTSGMRGCPTPPEALSTAPSGSVHGAPVTVKHTR